MRLTAWLILLIALVSPLNAFAQETPPIPRPRPDFRDNPQAVAPEGEVIVDEGATVPDQGSAANAAAALALPPQAVTISARITEDGPLIPDGLIWRVFSTQADENGDLPMVARSEDAVAQLSLAPGEYIVHAAYGLSQVSDTLTVEPQGGQKNVILDAGALRLTSAISGDFPITPGQIKFDIFTSGLSEDRVPVKLNAAPEEVIYLNAGVYNVVSRWGNVNATVRADLRVEPGQVTEATLYHKAAQITLKLVSSEGGEAIADVDWLVYDSDGAEIFSDFGAFPTAILAEGDYAAVARLGENVYNRDFQVLPGPPREVEVLTAVFDQ